jgi:hypothetical protein
VNSISSDKSAISDIHQRIDNLGQQFNGLFSDLVSKITPLLVTATDHMKSLETLPNTSSDKSVKTCLPLSYADAVTSNLPHVVKSVVAEAIKEHCIEERSNASVAIYGLPEKGRDSRDVEDILYQIYKQDIRALRCSRIGRISTLSSGATLASKNKQLRPLKVEFSSNAERDFVLSAFRQHRQYINPHSVNIAPWLNRDDFSKLKEIRQKCKDLNEKAISNGNKKRPYVVISGRLMIRAANGGKLCQYKESKTSPSYSVNTTKQQSATNINSNAGADHLTMAAHQPQSPYESNQPKNVLRGSQ